VPTVSCWKPEINLSENSGGDFPGIQVHTVTGRHSDVKQPAYLARVIFIGADVMASFLSDTELKLCYSQYLIAIKGIEKVRFYTSLCQES
jgi:hypothetical protein